MKGLITEEDWDSWKNDIFIDYSRDNHFTELKDAELLRDRLTTLDQASQYVGEYFSKEYIMKKILMLSDEDIKDMAKQSAEEPDPEPADNKEETPEVKPGT